MDRWTVIRQAAAQVLADFQAKSGLPAFPPEAGSHACLAEIARHCFGLAVTPDTRNLDERRIGHLDESVGITYWPGLTPERRDFIIAHQIGHKALDHPGRAEPDLSEDVDDLPVASALQGGTASAYDSRDRYELEANVFAAELLAPINQIRQRTAEQPGWTLGGLAGYFGLSCDAMANQIAAALLPGPVDQEAVLFEPPPLDEAQHAAAQVMDRAALVLAGPGAGKTRVLTERFRYLVERQGVAPRHILALTFANKAADEMRERLAHMLPEHAPEIQVFTFHSLGRQLLASYGSSLGLPTRFRIASDVDGFVLLRTRLSRLDLGHFEDLGYPTRNLRTLLEAIGKAKNELMGPDEYADAVNQWRREVEALPEPVHKDDIADRRRQRELIERFEDVARVYGQYQPWLREAGLVDYGDLLLESVRLFESDSVAADIHDRYRHILVDEFQDINYASGRLIRELDGGRQVTWGVGDPKQSIFRFQGASVRNLLAFQDNFPGARVIPLQTNYRSVAEIVATGEAIKFPSSSGQQRQHLFPAALTAARGSTPAGPVLRVARVGTQADEHAWMADEIRALQQTGMPLGDMAILCRKREQAQAVSGYLEGQGIATNWDGILQNNPLFKDMTAVIGLAADDPKALVRLASMPEHALAEVDVRALLRAVERSQSLSHALRRARDGKVSELSEEGRQGAVRLLDLYHQLVQRPMPWAVFAAYLFDLSQWPRALLHDDSLDGARSRATLGQVADLLRGFWSRGAAVADGQGAREFLRYVALAIESGRLETGTATATPRRPDAVNVLTMHGSKGLQWPVVFLPHQVEDTWKPSTDGDLPLPRFLPRDKDPLDSDEFEEACLLYVALTRAQDRLFVSSAKQGRFAGGREVRPHPLISGLRQILEASSVQIEFIELGDHGCPAEPATNADKRGRSGVAYAPFRFEDAVPHRLLEMYAGCGLKFLFHYVYRLDDGENRFRVFGKVVQRAMQRIAGAVAQGTPPSDQEMEQMFLLLWEKATGGEQDTGSLYVARGLQALQAFRDRLLPGASVTIGYEATFLVEGRLVSLRIDELSSDGSRWVVRKHHLSKPSTRHGKDKFFLGLQLANRQNNLRAPRTVLDYPLERKEEFVATPYGDRVAAHQNDITAAIAAIESGEFPPAPSAFKCRNCAFNLVCPAS